MTERRDYHDALYDILDAAEKAQEFSAGMDLASFSRDDKAIFATVRALEIIGEASKALPIEVRAR